MESALIVDLLVGCLDRSWCGLGHNGCGMGYLRLIVECLICQSTTPTTFGWILGRLHFGSVVR